MYTINGKDYTEFDINKRCAVLLGIQISFSRLPEKAFKLSVNSGGFTDEYNPCNNPQDTWPIIEKVWDDLMKIVHKESGLTNWEHIVFIHNCTKLVAACICLIECNGGE